MYSKGKGATVSGLMVSISSRLAELRADLDREDGFQTAEAIGIAAVGLIVLVAIVAVLEVLGVDVIEWFRSSFGVPES